MSALENIARRNGAFYRGSELMGTHFPAPRWAVPGLISEGLTLLAGAPKLGKSWLALSLCLDVARGAQALGCLDVTPGPVLYCALEDGPRRLQQRLGIMTGGDVPDALVITTSLPAMRLGNNEDGRLDALGLLDEYAAEHPDTRMIVVDVLGKIRPQLGNRDRYEADYAVIGALKNLADTHKLAVVAVTHTRKMPDEDAFSTVAGSTGLTGAADATLVLQRPRGEAQARLHVTGRDIIEAEYAVDFAPETGRWVLAGSSLEEARDAARKARATEGLGEVSAELVAFVNSRPEGVRAAEAAEALGISKEKVRVYLSRAEEAGRIAKASRGLYTPVMFVTSVTSSEESTSERNENNEHNTVCRECGEALHPMLIADGMATHDGCGA